MNRIKLSSTGNSPAGKTLWPVGEAFWYVLTTILLNVPLLQVSLLTQVLCFVFITIIYKVKGTKPLN